MAFNAYTQTAVTDSTYNVATTSAQLSTMANTSNATMNTALSELQADPNNPAKLANFQAASNEYSVIQTIIATVQKALKDASNVYLQKT